MRRRTAREMVSSAPDNCLPDQPPRRPRFAVFRRPLDQVFAAPSHVAILRGGSARLSPVYGTNAHHRFHRACLCRHGRQAPRRHRADPDPPRALARPSPQPARRPGGLSCVLLSCLCRVNRARVRCRADQSADRVGSGCVRSPACATPGFRLTPRPRSAYPYQREFRSATWRGSSAAGGGARLGIVARHPRKANSYHLLSPRIRPGPMGSSRGPCPVEPWAPSSLTISSAEVIAVGALRRSIENELDSCRAPA